MKLAPLLAQYLYTHKRLDLPGFGTFLLDPSVILEPESNKQNKPAILEGVSFENNPTIKETPGLIEYISLHTGKLKALAAADLDSHLGLALQFLNIGKPFLLEGIGNLVKVRSGEFTFTSGQVMPSTLKVQPVKEASPANLKEEAHTEFKSVFYTRKTKISWKKPLAASFIVAGLAFAIWGGYTVYKRTTAKNNEAPAKEKEPQGETSLVTDTTSWPKDSLASSQPIAVNPADNYKFIIETSAKERALSRYGKLKGFGLDVRMETMDSASFKLFFILPAAITDTARIVDSLGGLYTPAGSKAYIENQVPE
ncbi:MAG: hypothetical protein SGI83_06840 [Bacteroidota bacterium]|nr:hypothetical protein [Bacteroidota bacterium]